MASIPGMPVFKSIKKQIGYIVARYYGYIMHFDLEYILKQKSSGRIQLHISIFNKIYFVITC